MSTLKRDVRKILTEFYDATNGITQYDTYTRVTNEHTGRILALIRERLLSDEAVQKAGDVLVDRWDKPDDEWHLADIVITAALEAVTGEQP